MNHFLVALLSAGVLLASSARANVEIPTRMVETAPAIDGRLDETLWQAATPCSAFVNFKPTFGERPSEVTIAYTVYDTKNLYFAFRCNDRHPDQIKATLARRDAVWKEDYIGVAIDAANDGQFASLFCSNPLGVQADGILRADAEGDDSQDWFYESAGAYTDSGYTVEMRIPLKNLRFRDGDTVEMGLGFVRNVIRLSEQQWNPGYYPDRGAFPAQLGKVRFTGLRSTRTFEILPTVTHSFHRTREQGVYNTTMNETEFGVTTKIGITPTLILDATYNPDFSQIESDAGQVDVNLRYPSFYPEKRPFFMEGVELFQLAGLTTTSAIGAIVHTRNIAAPRWGAKLTGKVNQSGNLALLVTGDKSPRSYNPGVNEDAYFGVARYRQLQDADNFIGGIVSTREYNSGYNRIAGLDMSKRLTDNAMLVGNYLHFFNKSALGGDPWDGHNFDLSASYRDRNNYVQLGFNDITKNTPLETGFITRDGLRALGLNASHTYHFQDQLLQKITPSIYSFYQHDKYWNKDEGLCQGSVGFGFVRSSVVQLSAGYYTETFSGKVYDLSFGKVTLAAQPVNSLYFTATASTGGKTYYHPAAAFQGDQRTVDAAMIWQPTDHLSTQLDGSWNWFWRRSDNQLIYDYRLYRYRTTYQISRDLFLRGVLEYNAYRDELLTDLLVSFTYIPGTVVYLGYGALSEAPAKNLTDLSDREQGIFFKASYNWRL